MYMKCNFTSLVWDRISDRRCFEPRRNMSHMYVMMLSAGGARLGLSIVEHHIHAPIYYKHSHKRRNQRKDALHFLSKSLFSS